MRVATLFKRLLRLDGERVVGLELTEIDGREAVIVDLALRRRRAMFCSGCARRVRVALGAQIPDKFWILGTTIAGVLTGILVPPTQAQLDAQAKQEAQAPLKAQAATGDADAMAQLKASAQQEADAKQAAKSAHGAFWVWAQRQDWRLIVLGALFVVCGVAGLVLANTAQQGATQLFAVAGTAGAAALGILVPSPKTKP